MSNLTILRTYAQKDPPGLPPSILFNHSATTLTLYDAYPKSIFHFLILPRILPDLSPSEVSDLDSLRTLLQGDKTQAKRVITALNDEANHLRQEIEDEMVKRYGFKWGIWIGFHAVPSMRHLHLHVLSADLCSEKLKNKKHYNSFHPKLGFFLHVNDVFSWFDADETYFRSMAKLDPKTYEQLLKDDLSCWHCGSETRNIPALKVHLQGEWDSIAERERARFEKKREVEKVALEKT